MQIHVLLVVEQVEFPIADMKHSIYLTSQSIEDSIRGYNNRSLTAQVGRPAADITQLVLRFRCTVVAKIYRFLDFLDFWIFAKDYHQEISFNRMGLVEYKIESTQATQVEHPDNPEAG